jgi:transcription-repair coupling factor (superfamily II helicase)
MDRSELINLYCKDKRIVKLSDELSSGVKRLRLSGLNASAASLAVAAVFENSGCNQFVVLQDKESAAYFLNNLENLFDELDVDFYKKKVMFFPSSFRKPGDFSVTDSANVLLRTETLNRLRQEDKNVIVVSYPEALAEKVVDRDFFKKRTVSIKVEEDHSVELLTGIFNELGFDRVDFVVEPGQFAVRGGIMDVFSFSNDKPFRIEFFGDTVESIRSFDPVNQLSVDNLSHIRVVPDMYGLPTSGEMSSVFSYLNKKTVLWIDDAGFLNGRIDQDFEKASAYYQQQEKEARLDVNDRFLNGSDCLHEMVNLTVLEFGRHALFTAETETAFNISPQPSFNKKFEMLISQMEEYCRDKYSILILSDTRSQLDRITTIIRDLTADKPQARTISFETEEYVLHEGFIDHDAKLACFTDHQIFDRYHRFRLRDSYQRREAITLKEIYDLKPGDYVTHIDHGIGRYGGLEKVEVNGRQQEAIRIVYENNDLLYVSIHSLHRISKYAGKDGAVPSLSRLGSNVWNKLKNKTKQRVKDIAKDLIALYAKRKAAPGFAFAPDNYLQHELEASFIYEDTPDQLKSTKDVKKDMETDHPMDRLICGDVGFGKTEVAIRAAFKAVNDSKQVAVLVPTTILALQHFKTFSDRLRDFPCRVDYLIRFRSAASQKAILKDLQEGKIDILIGTHRLLSKDIKFKDLGLFIIDEEQKFGVAAKEKLKELRVNVDTLTLTATPIPRTLQFSLMGARDLSVINTPPPNRYPIQTELRVFSEEVIRDAILYEISRGGQIFMVHNRVQNIMDVADLVKSLCPRARVAVGHGQMEGHELEKTMLAFIDGEFDVLVATTIIESGLDIPNANTIIINDAHHYGLSDLHQLRGRVGRTNVKAFCYLLAPPLSVLTDEARKRLKAVEEFSDLGSGFNIAMRDLDIRGAGNILGGEQSGFISEIGFEMYHKILDEAIQELKETDFKDLYKDELKDKPVVRDCQIETDLEILIPDSYIDNINERLSLYKELDSTEDESGLVAFESRLVDRFGPLPETVSELLNAVRLRWLARRIGLEKIYLRENKFTGYFVSNSESEYYSSEVFTRVLQFVRDYPGVCRMKEMNGKLSIVLNNISGISEAIKLLLPLNVN